MSTLARSDAVQSMQNMPKKQNSSPLPEFPRIYERGHAHSRSWNPGYDDCEAQLMEPLQYQYDRIPPREPRYRNPLPTIFIPTIAEPDSLEEHHHPGKNAFHSKQAKSFDVSSNERRLSFDRRTSSLASRNLPPPDTVISAACQNIWAAKGHLEQMHALGISDPSSASTSFDSNTDSQSTPADPVRKVEDAERKRSKYRSLLVNRKMLSTAAVSSMDSTNSMESFGLEPVFASSLDSSGSDLEQRRLSLLHRHATVSGAPYIRKMERDYSVDQKSDNLFREWSRVDPAYDDHRSPLRRGVTQDVLASYNGRTRFYHRQHSIAGPLHAPLICFPNEDDRR